MIMMTTTIMDIRKKMIMMTNDHDDHGHAAHAFEWAGLFELKAGTYKWSFAKVDGDDPAMKMVILHDLEKR